MKTHFELIASRLRQIAAVSPLLLPILLLSSQPSFADTDTLSLQAPRVMPRNMPLRSYSPVLRLDYSELPPADYTLKVWLLETSTDHYYCASTQWCERHFKIPNTSGTNSSGTISVAEPMDVFDYPGFLWVARLYREGTQVASAQQSAQAVAARPPLLKRIGPKTGVTGTELSFAVTASDSDKQKLRFSARDLPAGAEFNPVTGGFKWTPTRVGSFRIIFEAVSQGNSLSDAEIVQFEIK